MAIKGVGTDIVEIKRIEKSYKQFGDKFVHRILSVDEQQSKGFQYQPIQFLAKRFAAKEALMKSLGTGLAKGIQFVDFSVLNDEFGKPYVELCGTAKNIVKKLGIKQFHISLSDEQKQAIAFVVAEG